MSVFGGSSMQYQGFILDLGFWHLLASLIKRLLTPYTKIVSKYHQEIPQSQIAGKPTAPRGKDTQQSRDTRKTTSYLFPIKIIK